MKIFNDFKKFINKGNILDLSVAVIIGTAFGKIVNSLVKDIITPVISIFMGPEGFQNYKYIIQEANPEAGILENAIYYGIFIQNILDFILIAIILFLIVKSINKAKDLSKNLVENTSKEIEKTKTKTNDLLLDIKHLLSENMNKG